MATATPIELRYYQQVDEDTVVFSAIWGLVAKGTTDPITHTPTEVHFDVIADGIAYCSLGVGNGLTWNDDTKQVSIQITNGDLNFITEDTTMTYKFYVVWDYGQAQTLREGTVNAVMVA